MSDFSSFLQHGEVHPFIQRNTQNTKQLADSGGARPWDQRSDETTKAYSAFLIYLDLGPHNRSQTKLAKIIYNSEKKIGQIQTWSVDHDWMNRAEAWDRFCMEIRQEKMEQSIRESEDIMLSYLPQVVENLCKSAAGIDTVGRAEMRAISDFLDRVGPAKQRRAESMTINNSLTINAPTLPDDVRKDTDDVPEAEVIEEDAENLIPKDLQEKRKKGRSLDSPDE